MDPDKRCGNGQFFTSLAAALLAVLITMIVLKIIFMAFGWPGLAVWFCI